MEEQSRYCRLNYDTGLESCSIPEAECGHILPAESKRFCGLINRLWRNGYLQAVTAKHISGGKHFVADNEAASEQQHISSFQHLVKFTIAHPAFRSTAFTARQTSVDVWKSPPLYPSLWCAHIFPKYKRIQYKNCLNVGVFCGEVFNYFDRHRVSCTDFLLCFYGSLSLSIFPVFLNCGNLIAQYLYYCLIILCL